jgi:hypothetical protein
MQVLQRIGTIDLESVYISWWKSVAPATVYMTATTMVLGSVYIKVPDECMQGGPEELRVVRCKLKIFRHLPTRPYKRLQLGKLRCSEHEVIITAVEDATVGRVYINLLERGVMERERW